MNTGIYFECADTGGHFPLKYHCCVFSNGDEVILFFFPLFPSHLLLTLQGEEYGGYRGRELVFPNHSPCACMLSRSVVSDSLQTPGL